MQASSQQLAGYFPSGLKTKTDVIERTNMCVPTCMNASCEGPYAINMPPVITSM